MSDTIKITMLKDCGFVEPDSCMCFIRIVYRADTYYGIYIARVIIT